MISCRPSHSSSAKGISNGDCQFSTDASSDTYLRKGVFACYRPLPADALMPADQKELGEAYKLVEIGETASFDQLVTELKVMEYLDSLIDRLLKRLLYLRGLKSISPASCSAHPARLPALGP